MRNVENDMPLICSERVKVGVMHKECGKLGGWWKMP